MALVGLSRAETFDYVSDKDPCKRRVEVPLDPQDPAKGNRQETVIDDDATVFLLSGLDVFLMGRIYDGSSSLTVNESTQETGVNTKISQTNIEACRFGLRGWRNFRDAKGNDLKFVSVKRVVNGREYTVASDVSLNALGLRLIGELGQQIKEASEISKAEEKNFVTAS